MKTLHKDSDNQTISTEPRVLQGAWVKIKPLDTPGRKKLIATGVEGGALSTVDSVRKNIAIHSHNFGKHSVGLRSYWTTPLDWRSICLILLIFGTKKIFTHYHILVFSSCS